MNSNLKSGLFQTAGAAIPFLLVVIALLLLTGCGKGKTESPAPTIGPAREESAGLVYDSGAVEGGWDIADTEAIIAGLNRKVEEGMINISMNTAPVFEDGDSAGSLMIVNESVNTYPQVVEIIRNDTGETVYRSGGIPVGSKIESAKLDVHLSAGTYECTAMFHNVDPETGGSLGSAGAVITITILK